jgi:hypothetical protein
LAIPDEVADLALLVFAHAETTVVEALRKVRLLILSEHPSSASLDEAHEDLEVFIQESGHLQIRYGTPVLAISSRFAGELGTM